MANIDNLCNSIVSSSAFRRRFRAAEFFSGSSLLLNEEPTMENTDVQRLILHASVLAFGEDIRYKRYAQKINALLHDLYPSQRLVNYAIQVVSSRLGNYPVVSPNSYVFRENNLYSLVSSGEQGNIAFDLDLATSFIQEEESARHTIRDKDYHFNIFQTEILDALSSRRLISFSAPTSFGKSFIVRHYIARLFAVDTLGACLIIVPTKSLIDDFFEDLVALKAELSLEYEVYTHTRSIENIEGGSIFVLTQERLSFLLSKNPACIKNFDLVYCDEAHYIARGYRGFLLRNVLKRLIEICENRDSHLTRTQYIFSSPIIKNPQYYHEKFFFEIPADEAYHKEIQYSPVEKNVFLITKDQQQFRYSLLHDSLNEDSFEERIVQIGHDNRFPRALQRNDSDEIDRDVHIVKQMELEGGTICYTTSPIMAHRYGLALSSVLPEENGRYRSEIDDLSRYVRDHYDDIFGITELLKKGIGLHYGPMPVGLRRAIVALFDKGAIDYIICTSTLLEGVNLPAKNIILFSDRYGGASGKEKHNALSFWNLIGRAGRITYGLSGNVFCIQKRQGQYEPLLETQDAAISDPEANVLERRTPRSHFERALLGEGNERFQYVTAHSRDDIEYLIFELLTSANPGRLLRSLIESEDDLESLLSAIQESRDDLSIPDDLVAKNPGIDPRLQDLLYARLQGQEPDVLSSYFSDIANPLSITGRKLHSILSLTV